MLGSNFSVWSQTVRDATEAVQRFFPDEPGELATKWLEVSVYEDGQDYVYDECTEIIEQTTNELQKYGNGGRSYEWAEIDRMEKKIELCEWILRHELMNSIPL